MDVNTKNQSQQGQHILIEEEQKGVGIQTDCCYT